MFIDGIGEESASGATAAARTLRSTACTVARSMLLRDVWGDEATLRVITQDPDGGALEPVDRAVYQFAGRWGVL